MDAGLRPALSVVIAAWNGPAALEQCLESLRGALQSSDIEVIAVTGAPISRVLRERFPRVRFLPLAPDTPVPELRTAGILASTGEIVALSEDHCRFGDNWSAEVVKAHRSDLAVIGGCVDNASVGRGVDWAVYFYDYGRYMPPMTRGAVGALCGANVSYKRNILLAAAESYREGFFEPFVHQALVERGSTLWLTPEMVVWHAKQYRLGEAMIQAYHLARVYAAKRARMAGVGKRALFAAGSPALFALLPLRVVSTVVSKKRHIGPLIRCLPQFLLLTGSWAWGELVGYLAGEGSSAEAWK